MNEERISLYFNDDRGSDKEYHADLLKSGDGWVCNFRYGRRGSALASGTKTKEPIVYEKAKKLFEKLVAEKMGKGYTPSETGTAYQSTPNEALFTGILPQLLNPVDECDLEALFKDPAWSLSVKHDGERRMTSNVGGEWFGINRKGMRVALPMPVVEGLAGMGDNMVIDGEIIGDVLHIFDVMRVGGLDVRDRSFFKRYSMLEALLSSMAKNPSIKLVSAHGLEESKRAIFKAVKESNGEGVCFKQWESEYIPGRPNTLGSQLKFKFVETATLVVDAQNKTKRSVKVAAFNQNGAKVQLGNVTIPPNHVVPEVGLIVSIAYLYAYPGGCLFQPVYLGQRTDQDLGDCVLSQLKYKPLAEAA